ncbi:winged helix-turn-helix domain-containing protein [Candidatus Bathyarchaeota archaeon]|nr:winged helix-turn-helix domain-containing protein [Candidatus Bathyarchaeota archaeon]
MSIEKKYRKKVESVNNVENDKKRRDRLYIIAEILTIAKEFCLKTQIMYRANLSFAQLNEYLSFLTNINLLKIQNDNKKNVYKTSAKGEKYLEKYKDISDILGRKEYNSNKPNSI